MIEFTPSTVNVSGVALAICPHCRHEQHEEFTKQLSTAPRAFDVYCPKCTRTYTLELRLVVHSHSSKIAQ